MIIGTITGIVFTTSLASSMFAPAVPQLLDEFHSDDDLAATLVVSIEFLGTAFGPIFLAPLSELYGRTIIYNVANILFCAFSIGCATTPTLGGLVALRFLQGCAAACAVINGGGTIGDLVPPSRRGAVMSLFTVGILFGPVIGPIAGSYLAQAAGWRWVFWLLTILNGTFAIVCFFVLRETYAPTILEKKAKSLREKTGNPGLLVKGQVTLQATMLIRRAITRPLKMLFTSPIIFGLSLYIAVVYGYIYLLFSTFSVVFEGQYGFNESTVGLAYLGLAVGMLISLGIASVVSDRIYMNLTKKHGVEKLAYRLETLLYGAVTIPIGLFIYGWTTDKKVHWVVPIIATGFTGFGVIFTFIPIQVYMIDAFTLYAASAIAACSIIRSIAAALVPLAGIPMYDRLGLGWGNSFLGFIALALGGLPLLFCRVGED